jgi:protocatechuate 3,4-dioxygenase beta subunit
VYRVAGTVVNAGTGEPVRHAMVALLAVANSHTVQSVLSGEDGHFALERLPAGKYQLTASKSGYLTSFYDQREYFNSAIVTGEGQDTEHLTFRLAPMAAIVVAVSDDGGDPVEKASVLFFRRVHNEGQGERFLARHCITDDAGRCEMDGLEAGEYFVAASAKPWYAMHASTASGSKGQGATRGNPALDVAYPVTFFDGVTDQASATPLVLTAGRQEHIEVVLHAVPALHLSVQIPHNAQGSSAPPQLTQSIFGFVLPQEGSSAPAGMENGVAEFTGVAPGNYELQQGGRLVELEVSSTNQQIAANTGTPSPAVHATVRNAGGTALAEVSLHLVWADPAHPRPQLQANCTAAECSFEAVPPGNWELWATSDNNLLPVLSTTTNGHSHAGNLVSVADQNLELAVAVQQAETRVEGMALKDGKGLAGVMIVLVPQNAGAHNDFVRRDQSDSDGSFSLQQVAPGSYTVVAIEGGWELEWARPEVLAPYLAKGIGVTVPRESPKIVRMPVPVPVQPRELKPTNPPETPAAPAETPGGTSLKRGGEDSL